MKGFYIISTLFFTLFLLCPEHSQAQKFIGGVRAGLGGSQIEGDNYGGYHKLAFDVGAFVQYPFNKYFSLQLEMSWSQKGSRANPNNKTGSTDMYKASLGYIQVPLLAQGSWKGFSLDLGPSFDFLAHASELRDNVEVRGISDWKRFHLGIIAGLRYSFKRPFALFFRFNGSITSLRPGIEMRNNVLLFGAEFRFISRTQAGLQ